MELLTKIINLDSTMMIYAYLMIFGKTTPAELRNITGLSKATMFRNLALLSGAGILDKEEEEIVDDKRYNLHYFITNNLFEMTKHVYTEELGKYADSIEKTESIMEWMTTVESLPFILNQLSSRLIMNMAKKPDSYTDSECPVISKLVVFRLGDGGQIADLNSRVIALVKDFDSSQDKVREDWKQPLKNPIAMSISVIALNPEEIPEDEGATFQQIICRF